MKNSESESILPVLVSLGLVERIMDLAEDGIIVHSAQRRIFLVNQAMERITGWSREAMLGADCHGVFGPLGLCGGACAFRDSDPMGEKNVFRQHEQVFARADGDIRRLSIRAMPTPVGGGTSGTLAVVRDITELSRLRLEMRSGMEFHGMIGISSAMAEVFELLRSVGPSEYPVLITGESGTGKELAARAIHLESPRASGPFVPINCGALPDNILESELFGHVRGAFTGAIQDKKGRFELAGGGTLFLDEVGELPLHMQVKLLRVLQEKSFERVGGEKPIQADVRIVAASNRDLRRMVSDGAFREDLFYRLCVVPLTLPPLRNRTEDIPHIARRILDRVSRETGRAGLHIDEDALHAILGWPWPGNVRELINAIQYASIRSGSDTIGFEHLPAEVRGALGDAPRRRSSPPVIFPGSLPENLSVTVPAPSVHQTVVAPPPFAAATPSKRPRSGLTVERVLDAIGKADGNRRNAAKILGVGRATLYRFLDAHPEIETGK